MRSTLVCTLGIAALIANACSSDAGGNGGDTGTDTGGGIGDAGGTSDDGGDDGGSGDDGDSGSNGTGDGTGTGTGTGSGTGSGDTGGTGTGTGTSTGTGTGGTDTGTGSDEVEPCDVAEATLQPVPPNIVLVLDKSRSMVTDENKWDHDGDGATDPVTRWNSLYTVLENIFTNFDDQINFGAVLFPSTNVGNADFGADACQMETAPDVAVAASNGSNILTALPDKTSTDIYGATPATAGITLARDHLNGLTGDNPPAMLLITDGAANCGASETCPDGIAEECTTEKYDCDKLEVYDSALETTVGDAYSTDGIPTYVVGIDIADSVTGADACDGAPEVNPTTRLNTVAENGGQPQTGASTKFYQTTDQTELQTELDNIIKSTISCTVPLSPEPSFPDLLEVYIGGSEVPRVSDCATENGWVYTNPSGPYDAIELCGTWCDSLKDEGSLKAEYYCLPG